MRRLDTGNLFHVDYALLLTMGEAAAWDEECREAFAADRRSQFERVVEAMHLLEMRLKSTSWVVVESYEWDSGME